MNLPILKVPGNRAERQTIAFRGVRYGEGAQEGELEDSRNLTSARFPCLSPRAGRAEEGSYKSATAVFFKGKMLVVDGTKLLYGGVEIGTVSEGEKQIVAVNSKVVIFPDKIMYDVNTETLQSLEASYTGVEGSASFTANSMYINMGAYRAEVLRSGVSKAFLTGSDYPFQYKISSVSYSRQTGEITFGEKIQNATTRDYEQGSYFCDDGLGIDGVTTWGRVTENHMVYVNGERRYRISYDVYHVVGVSYGSFTGYESAGFKVGDTIEISGCTTMPENNRSLTIRGFTMGNEDGTQLPTIVFDSDVFQTHGVEAGAVTIRRKVPNLSAICESSNRLWGADGNTIYASALGDPTNFFTYDGLDTDSYAVAVASEGDFTGCIGYGTGILFFKEDRLYKILGSYPSQYTMYDYTVPGVKKGSEKSLRNINEVLYYHGREGVYRYSGGAPELITENFGLRRFQNACAGAEGGRYYISMQDRGSLEWGMWVYDIQRGIWLQEDGMQAVDFASDGGKLYCAAGDGRVLVLNPDSSGETVEWSAVTCRMDETYLNRKCYSRILLRLEIGEGSWVQAEVSHDGGPWQLVYTDHDSRARVREIPIMPRRCDSFRVRLSGEGETVIRSMVREYRVSSTAR